MRRWGTGSRRWRMCAFMARRKPCRRSASRLTSSRSWRRCRRGPIAPSCSIRATGGPRCGRRARPKPRRRCRTPWSNGGVSRPLRRWRARGARRHECARQRSGAIALAPRTAARTTRGSQDARRARGPRQHAAPGGLRAARHGRSGRAAPGRTYRGPERPALANRDAGRAPARG